MLPNSGTENLPWVAGSISKVEIELKIKIWGDFLQILSNHGVMLSDLK